MVSLWSEAVLHLTIYQFQQVIFTTLQLLITNDSYSLSGFILLVYCINISCTTPQRLAAGDGVEPPYSGSKPNTQTVGLPRYSGQEVCLFTCLAGRNSILVQTTSFWSCCRRQKGQVYRMISCRINQAKCLFHSVSREPLEH